MSAGVLQIRCMYAKPKNINIQMKEKEKRGEGKKILLHAFHHQLKPPILDHKNLLQRYFQSLTSKTRNWSAVFSLTHDSSYRCILRRDWMFSPDYKLKIATWTVAFSYKATLFLDDEN